MMKRKEDLTMTNKKMLVAELRKEQEQNRILRIELEKAKREKNFAEMDAYAAICMFNDESRKMQSHIKIHKAEIERLKAENEKLLDSIESVQAGRCRLRCPLTEQAVKEFAERLKKYSYTDNCFKDGKWHRYVLVSDIDILIKRVEND